MTFALAYDYAEFVHLLQLHDFPVTDNVGRGPGKELPEREQASVVKEIRISVVNVLALSDVKLDKDE